MPSLFVIRGNDQGHKITLQAASISVGRDSANQVQLHDQEVSRHHAELRRLERGYAVIDLGSSNGTFINGKRVTEQLLQSGDHLQLGGTLMLYTGPAEEGADDLAARIDIVAGGEDSGDNSRIVHSLSQDEGSQLFRPGGDASESPWLARARSNLQVMYRTALAVSHTLDIDQLLTRIMQLIFEWVEADHGCILLVDPLTKKLERRTFLDRRGAAGVERIVISQTILDYVMQHNEGVLTSNARDDQRWDPAASILQLGIREAICVPMQGRYDVVGVIYIDTVISPQRMVQMGGQANKFTQEHLKLMIAIAHQAALAVEDTRYYSAMVQAERLAAVGQAIASLSHHIKNILQGIRGGSFLIKEGLAKSDSALITKGWQFVERRQEQISHLVLDMLTFSKEREPDLLPADLNATVADVVELMQSRAADLKVALQWTPGNDIPRLTFDDDLLSRAVLNVVTNAIDACEGIAGGQVVVATHFCPETSLARISVEDNGTGIEPEELDKIFTLFVSHKASRGTGLGLPVSQKIMQEHGGTIRVTSEPGRGSCFVLEFQATPVGPDDDLSGESIKATQAG